MAQEYQKQGLTKCEYDRIHFWLKNNRDKGDKCIHCESTGVKLHNALISGRKYRARLDSYISLCAKCHRKYDAEHAKKTKSKPVIIDKKYISHMPDVMGKISDIMIQRTAGKNLSELAKQISKKVNMSKDTVKKYLSGDVPLFYRGMRIIKELDILLKKQNAA